MKLRNPFKNIPGTPIEWGLIVALIVVTGPTAAGLVGDPPPPAPPVKHWYCPAGTVMVGTSRFYPPTQPACVAGLYATRK